MGYGAFYVICPRASSQYVTPLVEGQRSIEVIRSQVKWKSARRDANTARWL